MAVLVLDYFQRVGQVFEDNAFFFGFFDLYHIGRHFVFSSSVDIVNFFGTQSYGSPACVHGSVSAADDSNFLADADLFVPYYSSQEIDTADNAFCVFSLAAYAGGDPCAYGQEDCVVVGSDGVERNTNTDLGVGDDVYAHSFDGVDLFVQDFFRKSVFRDTISEHAACFRHGLEYGNCVSHLSEEVSS